MTTTKLDAIAAQVQTVLASADTDACEDLLVAMDEYEETFPRTIRDLRQVPAFRKLWDALIAGASEGSDKPEPITEPAKYGL